MTKPQRQINIFCTCDHENLICSTSPEDARSVYLELSGVARVQQLSEQIMEVVQKMPVGLQHAALGSETVL